MTPALHALLLVAEKLTTRLRILQRTQIQARERGETVMEFAVGELFDAADQEAIDAWERAKAAAMGAVPLFDEAAP